MLVRSECPLQSGQWVDAALRGLHEKVLLLGLESERREGGESLNGSVKPRAEACEPLAQCPAVEGRLAARFPAGGGGRQDSACGGGSLAA